MTFTRLNISGAADRLDDLLAACFSNAMTVRQAAFNSPVEVDFNFEAIVPVERDLLDATRLPFEGQLRAVERLVTSTHDYRSWGNGQEFYLIAFKTRTFPLEMVWRYLKWGNHLTPDHSYVTRLSDTAIQLCFEIDGGPALGILQSTAERFPSLTISGTSYSDYDDWCAAIATENGILSCHRYWIADPDPNVVGAIYELTYRQKWRGIAACDDDDWVDLTPA
jgi:hypothetical protein